MRAWWGIPATLLLLMAMGHAMAQPSWIQLDDPPPEDADPQVEDAADLVDLFFAANATHFFFREDLAALSDVGNFTYAVYIDNPIGEFDEDYRLVHSQSGSYLEQWNGSAWVFVEDIAVTEDATNNSLIFEVPIASAGGTGSNMQVGFENYEGADSFGTVADRAPNGGRYLIQKRSIPNLPWLVLPFFGAALTATLLLLRRRLLPL